jgi:DNA repair and recombination protein RAD52
MAFTPEQVAALQAPLSRSHVRQRSQAGRNLSYLEGWKVIEEANRIFGFDAWDRETLDLRELGEPRQVGDKWRVAYMARVRITVRSAGTLAIRRDGCGYGSGIDRDLGTAHESAIKEAETDSMKRALMTFGYPFGLALYDKDQAHVVDDARPNGAEPAGQVAKPAPAKGEGPLVPRQAEALSPLAGIERSANPNQARKHEDWDKILNDLIPSSLESGRLLLWAKSRSGRLAGHPWRKEALEQWREYLGETLATECHSARELIRWREESHEHTSVLPTDWQLAASAVWEAAKAKTAAQHQREDA